MSPKAWQDLRDWLFRIFPTTDAQEAWDDHLTEAHLPIPIGVATERISA